MSLQNSNLETGQPKIENNLNSNLKTNKSLVLLEKIENFTVATLLFFILITVLAQVYSRFVTGESITWAGELSRFIAVWLIFLGSAICLRRNLHIQVDNLYNVVPNMFGLILYIVRNVIILAFLVIILTGSMDILEIVSMQISPGLGIRMDLVYIILPISLCLMVIILLLQTIIRFSKKRS